MWSCRSVRNSYTIIKVPIASATFKCNWRYNGGAISSNDRQART